MLPQARPDVGVMQATLHRLARSTQATLLSAATAPQSPGTWAHTVPRVMLDTWATLARWHLAGEPCIRLTDEQEQAVIDRPLPPDMPLADAPLRTEALAIALPERAGWLVIARHPERAVIPVREDVSYSLGPALITYVAGERDGEISAGYVSLRDMPTPGQLTLRPGRHYAATGKVRRVSDSEHATDDYRLAVGITVLYSRP